MNEPHNNVVDSADPALLLCTVGGRSEPILKTIQEFRPQRVLFLASATSRATVVEEILPALDAAHCGLTPGQYEIHAVPDAEDIAGCISVFREQEAEVQKWMARGPTFRILVDITAGTKCMTAALTLVAHRWRCTFLYVGGAQRGPKGMGAVETGSERVVSRFNPWEGLGYQSIEDAIMLFDGGNYAAAELLLKRAIAGVDDTCARQELDILSQLVQTYQAWDHFRHKRAGQLLESVQKNFNNLRTLLPWTGQHLKAQLASHRILLQELQAPEPGLSWVHDLMANAWRKAEEQRYGDAVARLYRAIEALAQAQLRRQYGLDVSALHLEQVPEPLRQEWAPGSRDGKVQLALQEDYRLLGALGDALGPKFQELGLDDRKTSPLQARNHSVLAHGYKPVSEKDWQALWKATLQLTGVAAEDLVRFPQLGRPRTQAMQAEAGR